MQRSKDGVSCDSPVARLYELHATAIFAYLRRQTASREDAEDLLVEVFVVAVESSAFDRLGEKEQVAWLWRVAHHKAVDAYRRSRLRQGVDLELVDMRICMPIWRSSRLSSGRRYACVSPMTYAALR